MKFLLGLFFISLIAPISSNCYAQGVLSQQEAQARFKQVSDIHYHLNLDLSTAGYTPQETAIPEYRGKVLIDFKVSTEADQVSDTLSLDFSIQEGGGVQEILLNNQVIPFRWNDSKTKIFIPSATLKKGVENHLQLSFSNRFTRKGKGFHRAIDQEDKEAYIFTNLEPYYANEVFPLFDQPDLKAVFELRTKAPSHWQVVSNTPERQKLPAGIDQTEWVFSPTQTISSYLFAVIAGPFHIWESQTSRGIPLRLMARKTLAKYVNAEQWFQMTQEGFQFYESNFGFPYPFEKYDQVIVPETASGAMENVGAVTFNENYVSRGKMTLSERTHLAETLTHELAHMWFGNLVTLKWWDDLWLNESFATFASYLVIEAASKRLGLEEPWQSFHGEIKEGAYEEDGYQTTHPVVGAARDTVEASSIFDAITYEKGASTLKQLYFYLGKENFFKGLGTYFKKFAFQNATRTDFLDVLSEASNIDLANWDEEWLRTSGINSVKASLETHDGKISSLIIEQFPDPMVQRLRSHRTQLGLYDLNLEGEIILRETIPVQYNGDRTVIREVIGKSVPTFLFLNTGDYDYSQVILDESSLEKVRTSLSRFKDPLLRQQLYASLGRMVTHSQIAARDYVEIVIKHVMDEVDPSVLDVALGNLRASLLFLGREERFAVNNQAAKFLLEKLGKMEPGSAPQEKIFSAFLPFARSAKHLTQIEKWLSGADKIEGLEIDQDRRWRLISTLARGAYTGISKIIRDEREKDSSNRGILLSKVADVRRPYRNIKERWFKELSTPKKVNTADARAIMPVFHDPFDERLTLFVETGYFDAILAFVRENDLDRKVTAYASTMYPVSFSKKFSRLARAFVQENEKELPLMVRRAILKRVEDAARIRKARRVFE